jgi:hypothetical protein
MKKTIYVSDISGQPIEDGQEATVLITYRENGRKLGYKLDCTKNEAQELGKSGKAMKFSTGRKRQSTSDQLAALSH